MGIQRYTWVYTGIHGYIPVYMGIHQYTWVYTGIYGYTPVYMCIHRYAQVYMGIHQTNINESHKFRLLVLKGNLNVQ